MSDDTVYVAVRLRPLVQSEIDSHCQNCLQVVPGRPQLKLLNSDKTFTYNYVLPPETEQNDLYQITTKNLITNIFKGFNVTVLAYGQTGAGKTHTLGFSREAQNNPAIIHYAITDIFEHIKLNKQNHFNVKITFLELYHDQLYDLLSTKQRSQSIVDIRENEKNIKLVRITEKEVTTAQETLEYLNQGSRNRITKTTSLNENSSRSHAIFTISVQQQKKDDANTIATVAKFQVVDLAGSERTKKTQTTEQMFKETININKGLLTLGTVISQLAQSTNINYISFRDNKLTRLLQEALGGHSKILMIACVSPADCNIDETLSTLRYAERMIQIKNTSIVNNNVKILETKSTDDIKVKLTEQIKTLLSSAYLNTAQQNKHKLFEQVRTITTARMALEIACDIFVEDKKLQRLKFEELHNQLVERENQFHELENKNAHIQNQLVERENQFHELENKNAHIQNQLDEREKQLKYVLENKNADIQNQFEEREKHSNEIEKKNIEIKIIYKELQDAKISEKDLRQKLDKLTLQIEKFHQLIKSSKLIPITNADKKSKINQNLDSSSEDEVNDPDQQYKSVKNINNKVSPFKGYCTCIKSQCGTQHCRCRKMCLCCNMQCKCDPINCKNRTK